LRFWLLADANPMSGPANSAAEAWRPPPADDSELVIGDRVLCDEVECFSGRGTIVAIEGERALVEFDDTGNERWLEVDELERLVARPPEYSDEALALKFAERHADRLRHVALWGKWFCWDGSCWRVDETLLAFNRAREVCREAAQICGEKRFAGAIASAKTVAAIERLARADRQCAATVDQWDADLWLLNTPGGIVDLCTGELRPSAPEVYASKITAAAPDGACQTPLWTKFLDDVTAGDGELIAFLQRMAGYLLTGSTREHAFFFIYGPGGNGKGTFVDTITGCMGEYHRAAAIETFTVTNTNRHPTELASLRGARCVTASETEQGRRWAESKLKLLTGQSKITAYFMRQDPFDYTPQFKLLFEGNHKPGLRSIDEAIRRRLHLILFPVKIRDEVKDLKLRDKLKVEWPGILLWMIEGCMKWQTIGLAPPEAVRAATDDYLESEDSVAAWIEECCEPDSQARELISNLYANWRAYADKNGVYAGSKTDLGDKLVDKGFLRDRGSRGKRMHVGLRIKPLMRRDGSASDEQPAAESAPVGDDTVPF
jgi:putative DNA primase/helicase